MVATAVVEAVVVAVEVEAAVAVAVAVVEAVAGKRRKDSNKTYYGGEKDVSAIESKE